MISCTNGTRMFNNTTDTNGIDVDYTITTTGDSRNESQQEAIDEQEECVIVEKPIIIIAIWVVLTAVIYQTDYG